MHGNSAFTLEWAIFCTGERWEWYQDLKIGKHDDPRKVAAVKYLKEFRKKIDKEYDWIVSSWRAQWPDHWQHYLQMYGCLDRPTDEASTLDGNRQVNRPKAANNDNRYPTKKQASEKANVCIPDDSKG